LAASASLLSPSHFLQSPINLLPSLWRFYKLAEFPQAERRFAARVFRYT
jgi:hypothetical protein